MPVIIRVLLGVIVLTAATYDFRYRRIPNWLNLSGLILGLGLNVFFFHAGGALKSGQGLLLATAVYLPLYLLRGMGAGDVKLMAAVGSLVGPGYWFEIFIVTAIAGGAAAGIFACLKGRFTDTCWNVMFLLKDLAHFRSPRKTNPQLDVRNPGSLRLPHGVLIALGSCIFLTATFLHPSLVLSIF